MHTLLQIHQLHWALCFILSSILIKPILSPPQHHHNLLVTFPLLHCVDFIFSVRCPSSPASSARRREFLWRQRRRKGVGNHLGKAFLFLNPFDSPCSLGSLKFLTIPAWFSGRAWWTPASSCDAGKIQFKLRWDLFLHVLPCSSQIWASWGRAWV